MFPLRRPYETSVAATTITAAALVLAGSLMLPGRGPEPVTDPAAGASVARAGTDLAARVDARRAALRALRAAEFAACRGPRYPARPC